ncbi:hypothetical protein J4050_10285 [Winogradskyella sp. DF17]|uniref:Antitoxin component YwqK of YwqJK toxin-antitoxin module n=1 Tax=Winogradskyella pelagia TaxID=2819984 RepID=A0ABS3T320_9FLAO|nr:toxin-antitoxin system YwqK family antitoxin [Winogradskyella sp. DF17]MBO3117136.1 hypothetical protein [Winogradskyella sp. DF17]
MAFPRILLLILCVQFSFAQQLVPFEDYYETGELKTEGFKLENKNHGDWKSYYKNGQLQRQSSYTKGQRNPEYVVYYENGQISEKTEKSKGVYINTAYYKTGELFYERQYKTGFCKGFYKTGAVKTEAYYENFEIVGLWKSFDEDGNLIWEVTYKDGYREGLYKSYNKSGVLKLEGYNVKDKKQGVEKRYSTEGILEWKGSYKDNKLSKSWTKYDVEGIKIDKVKFNNGIALNAEVANIIRPTTVPSGLFNRVPIYPGCEGNLTNITKRNCMSQKVATHFNKNFNIEVAVNQGLSGLHRIIITFKVDKEGKVNFTSAKTPHVSLQEECKRIIGLLPKMTPGIKRDEPVEVPYSFPVAFQIRN